MLLLFTAFPSNSEVNLPHLQYFLQLCDDVVATNIVHLDPDCGLVRGMQIGKTKIHLMDRNFMSTQKIQESTEIHVTEPAYIR